MKVFRASEIGRLPEAESSGAFFFAREEEPTDCFAGGQKKHPQY